MLVQCVHKQQKYKSELKKIINNKHSSRMLTDHATTRTSSEQEAMRLIVDSQTHVKTLPSPCDPFI